MPARVILLGMLVLGGLAAQPFVYYRGVVNAASYALQGLPNGSIARGSIFSIFGRNLGPNQSAIVSSFPLGASFQGVSIEVCRSGDCLAAVPLFVSAGQINAIMPSNTPLGGASLRVTYNGQAGNFSPVDIVASSFGIFAVNSGGYGPALVQNFVSAENQPVNSAISTARPGQTVIAWGTGLGAGLNADNVAPQVGDLPVDVEIWVGNQPVTVKRYSGRTPCCAGLDQIVFDLPAGTPTGCYVPVQIRAGGRVTSNTVTLALDAEAGPCRDPGNPLQPYFVPGGKLGIAVFEKARTLVETASDPELELDAGAVFFSTRKEAGSPFFYNPVLSLPPAGACVAWSVRGSAYRADGLPGLAATAGALDAGGPLQVQGAPGEPSLNPLLPDLRSFFADFNATAGPVTLSGPGGRDVGAFNAAVTPGQSLDWTNRARTDVIDRRKPLRVEWAAQPGVSTVAIVGGNYDAAANGSGVFLCLAAAAPGAFEVPPHILAVVPLDRTVLPLGRLFLGAVPRGGLSEFQAPGLDRGVALFLNTMGRPVSFR
jgi:uncharacterized protein (TIGR03437 family)